MAIQIIYERPSGNSISLTNTPEMAAYAKANGYVEQGAKSSPEKTKKKQSK